MGLEEFKERLPTMSPDTEQKIAVGEAKGALQRRTVQAQTQANAQIKVARATPKPDPAPVATPQPATEEPAKPNSKATKPKASTKKVSA